MGDLTSLSERRSALRVRVRGTATVFDDGGATRATIENLSTNGVLLSIASDPHRALGSVELMLGIGRDRIRARTVRVERMPSRTRLAISFGDVNPQLRAAIDGTIDHAVLAAARRPIVIIDDSVARRATLLVQLAEHGMTALAPITPLDTFAQVGRLQRYGCVCLLAPAFGQSVHELRMLLATSFPWATTDTISDDLDATLERALAAWGDGGTPMFD